MAVGLNSRPKEWSRPPEPHPPDAGCWCSRNKRTVCELDLVQHTIRSSKRAQTLDPNQRPECVFRAKSATDSELKSATDSDLISAIPI